MLLDSNIIIYSAKREHAELRHFLRENLYSVSAVSRIEVLGYHLLAGKQREYLEKFFDAANILTISDSVVTQAVQLRQEKRMSLGDAIIAGTALAHQLKLVTRNVRDFDWIQGLSLINPIEIL
ncbi:MAG TPA: type II toxin-antitoxin system VapC family toxin [Pyrinomonadaceae bacterium]|jgi:predicted nucleic acid-binding protein|nr:type II toxin-antitoxin system VapC family toxin [Pyrinomonadaceae bacterium]